MKGDTHDRRTTAAATVAALAMVAGLVGFQQLGRTAPPEPRPTAALTPLATDSPSAPASPSTSPRPVPADWTTLDPRPVGTVDLDQARDEPVEDPDYPQTSNPEVDALRYQLALDWDGDQLTATADVLLRMARTAPELRLDLDDRLQVDEVTLDGERLVPEQSDDHLVVRAPGLTRDSRHRVVVRYSGQPTSVAAPTHRPDDEGGLGWAYDEEGNVSTYQEPYGAYTWYPVNDHPSDKAFYDIQVTAPVGQVGVSGGRLVGRTDADGRVTTRWHLDSPASSYLTTMAIGAYRQHVRTFAGGVVASVWTLPQDEDRADALMGHLGDSFAYLTRAVGPYPFSSTGMVVTAGQSAMETQTLITMGRAPVMSAAAAVTTHELAHQWFGDAVTTRDWTSLWLNEGWAMYWELAYRKDARLEVATPQQAAEGCAASVAVAGQAGRPRKDYFADDNVYLCPATMLHELRVLVGDDAFRRLARQWPAAHRGRTATRAEFEAFAQQVTGRDIRPLTHTWLDAVGTTPPPVHQSPAPARTV